ncbi:hypothetical protein MPSEU_000080200 [Mayamaea pseudoterrestris]|nr:hypothetical protein MPSEU_000080200 [Mayamaea pseudoterrestris]
MHFQRTLLVTSLLLASNSIASNAFVVRGPTSRSASTHLYGLFDGVKEAFKAPALERSTLNSERETPIDRWMGWSVASENEGVAATQESGTDFIDSMDESNYLVVQLTKPMGIVFEENDSEFGGIFVQSLKAGGAAAVNGQLLEGDQLVAVNAEKVSGLPFDDALSKILESEGDSARLTIFRGTAKQFYGATGPSQAWLDEFLVNKSAGAPQSKE